MPHIELNAGTQTDRNPQFQQTQCLTSAASDQPDLDDALARLLRAVRATGNDRDMDALGALLGYMESLERKTEKRQPKTVEAVVLAPYTLTVG